MSTHDRTAYVTRDRIMQLLSDDEVARVSTLETGSALVEGDEYVDLDDLDRGVKCADGREIVMDSVLPRKAVREITWIAILDQVASHRLVSRA